MADRIITKIGANTASHNDIVSLYDPNSAPKVILICEHASNCIPPEFNDLGLTKAVIESHVAWDPGALALAKEMAKILSAPIIFQKISRLIYDCNRPPESPTAMLVKSEIYNIIGNENLSEQDKQSRVENYYTPFNNAVSLVVDGHISHSSWHNQRRGYAARVKL